MLRLTRTAAHTYEVATLYIHPRWRHAQRWGVIPKGARYLVGEPGVYTVAPDIHTAVQMHQALFNSAARVVQVIVDASAPTKRGRYVSGGRVSTDSTLPGMLPMDLVNSLAPRLRRAGTTRRS